MRLVSLELIGFRHFGDGSTILFDPNLTVLVGLNGSGKSSVLDAVSCALDGQALGEGGADDKWELRLTVEHRGKRDVVRASAQGGKVVRELRDSVAKALPKGADGSTVEELRAFVGAGGARLKKAELQVRARELVNGLADADLQLTWVPLPTEFARVLPRVTRSDAESITDVQKSVDGVLAREFRVFLAKNAKGWAELNARFEQRARKALQDVNDAVDAQCSDIADRLDVAAAINLSRPRIDAEVTVQRDGVARPVTQLSLGQRRRLALAVADGLTERLGKDGAEVLLYDEPDTHLDYAAQVRQLGVLRDQATKRGVQLVIATHSPRIINDTDVAGLVHLRLDDAGSVTPCNLRDAVGDHSADILRDLDESLSNVRLLHDQLVVVCEGESEEAALPILYQRHHGVSLASDGVALVSRSGSGDAPRMAGVLSQIRGSGVILLLDADQRSSRRDGRTTDAEDVEHLFLGQVELEDCFSDADWTSVLNALLDEVGLETRFAPADIMRWRVETNGRGDLKGLSKVMDRELNGAGFRERKGTIARLIAEKSDPTTWHRSLVDALDQIRELARG